MVRVTEILQDNKNVQNDFLHPMVTRFTPTTE